MAPSWKKPVVKLTEAAYVMRAWVIDLDEHFKETGIEITPCDLFDPTLFENVRTRKLFDRGDNVTSLREGEICRVVRQEGPDPFDIDLVCKAALPGGLIMELRGARTPWGKLVEAEKNAAVQRRQAAQAAAATLMGEGS
jgi:hypothetical protein